MLIAFALWVLGPRKQVTAEPEMMCALLRFAQHLFVQVREEWGAYASISE